MQNESNSVAAADGNRRFIIAGATLSRAVAAAERQAVGRINVMIFVRRAAAVTGVALFLAVAFAAIVACRAYAQVPHLVAQMEAAAGVLSFSPEQLPPARLCAVLSAQDSTFLTHHGIGLTAGRLGQTTITQAIGKFMLFEKFSPGFLRFRKMQLMFASLGIDQRLSKGVQLRIFLNRAYFGTSNGREVLGFPAAAREYFGRNLTELDDHEFFAVLAMLDGPNRFHVIRAPAVNEQRAQSLHRQARGRCRT